MNNETISVSVDADTRAFDAAMNALTESTKDFGKVFSSTIASSIKSGKGFEDTLRSIGQRFIDLALNQALKPLDGIFNDLLSGFGSAIAGGFGASVPGFAKGGAFDQRGIVPFARGGVVSSPTAFGFANQVGVMGEAGPEAIMPLQRGSDGRLGVASTLSSTAPSITFNVQASDAQSFRKSEGQITAMLARAVARGQRNL